LAAAAVAEPAVAYQAAVTDAPQRHDALLGGEFVVRQLVSLVEHAPLHNMHRDAVEMTHVQRLEEPRLAVLHAVHLSVGVE
jgi:hypothetical protein